MTVNKGLTVSFTIPYMPELSKNRRYAFRGSKRKSPAHFKAQRLITLILNRKLALAHFKPSNAKLWVDIVLFKPTIQADASNFINPINDAIVNATGIDDKYYAGSYDWEIDKKNPRIEIKVRF
jgi:hypothetical protein